MGVDTGETGEIEEIWEGIGEEEGIGEGIGEGIEEGIGEETEG